MSTQLKSYIKQLEKLAASRGLDYFPVNFELVPPSFMMEVAVYGLPVRMPHWSFGVRYIYQLIQHRMGHSHLFEVVFPGNPGRAFLSDANSTAENTLVFAHVLGHADFSHNNALFRNSQEQVGYHVVEQAAAHAYQISNALETHGQEQVEIVLDAALALEQYIDISKGLRRPRYPVYEETKVDRKFDPFVNRFLTLSDQEKQKDPANRRHRTSTPPYPEHDLLWFIANYGPELEDWERDIFLAVREESFYFYPVFACQIMNEGWACLWHATLLREAKFLPHTLFLDAMKAHSDVVRPYAGKQQISLAINPYHVGFVMWNHIIKEQGIEKARNIMMQDDDFSFIRNQLTENLADELELFQFKQQKHGCIKTIERDLNELRELLIAKKFNFGAPRIHVEIVQSDGTLVLRHDHEVDGRGLDLHHADKVLKYIHLVWRRPIVMHTVDEADKSISCEVS